MNVGAKMAIAIPPRSSHHREVHSISFREDVRILSLFPHMHLRGKSWRYELVHPDGRTETLLSVPRWDFNWQTPYQFAEPVRMPRGAKLRSIVHYDNSDNNPHNPDPSKTVRYGLQTYEEMMNAWVQYVREKPDR
jgi:hypothetical protein